MFQWAQFLEVARGLSVAAGRKPEHRLTEAALRSAASRAYYAAYCHARGYAEANLGFTRSRGVDDHADVRDCIRRSGLVAEASSLDDLRKWRNMCDYDDIVANCELLARASLTRAEQVIKALS